MEFETNTDILKDLMDQLHTLHKENARLIQEIEALEKHNEELNRKLKSIQALFLWKCFDFLQLVWYLEFKMKHEGKVVEPRDIVKANAEIYRNNELIRMEKEEYNRWLAVHVDEKTKKNHPDKNNEYN